MYRLAEGALPLYRRLAFGELAAGAWGAAVVVVVVELLRRRGAFVEGSGAADGAASSAKISARWFSGSCDITEGSWSSGICDNTAASWFWGKLATTPGNSTICVAGLAAAFRFAAASCAASCAKFRFSFSSYSRVRDALFISRLRCARSSASSLSAVATLRSLTNLAFSRRRTRALSARPPPGT